jgi:hypothetical protein
MATIGKRRDPGIECGPTVVDVLVLIEFEKCIANVYNSRHHQPTQQQVDAAKAAGGVGR